MKIYPGPWTFYLSAILGLFLFLIPSSKILLQTSAQPYDLNSSNRLFTAREDAYRANNIGVAQLEQYNYAEAAESFRRALTLDAGMRMAQINLAIALFNAQEIEEARKAAEKALVIAPGSLQTHYVLGLIARNQNRVDEALAYFQFVLTRDPLDVGANVNVGQIYTQQRRYSESIAAFRRAYQAEPYNSTAIYSLATSLIRNDQREEGQRLIERFQALRQSGAATSIGQSYLEQGRYAEALISSGAEPELVDKTAPNIVFQGADIGFPKSIAPADRNARMPVDGLSNSPQGATTLFDFDNDGDLDLIQVGRTMPRVRLLRNDSGRFTDVTRGIGELAKASSVAAKGIVAADFDNDTFEDLLIFGRGRPGLFRGNGKGSFKDVTLSAKLPVLSSTIVSGAFADIDHDGDLDIFLAGFAPSASSAKRSAGENKLFRNNGDGTFTDISAAAGINPPARAVAVIPTDFDNRRDMDLLILNYDEKPVLLKNLRDGTFRDVAEESGLNQPAKWTAAAVGDFNKDSFVDFYFGREGRPGVFAVSDGRGKHILRDASAGTKNTAAAHFVDYDNDGLLDLIASTDKGFVVLRNLGDRWLDADSKPFEAAGTRPLTAYRFLSADIDRDGDIDLVTIEQNGSIQFLKNIGAETKRSENINLKGRVSNRGGIGAKIDLRSGSLWQKLESYSASPAPAPSDIHFGLGSREKPDAIRIIWPSGVVQAEVEFRQRPKGQLAVHALTIEELDRKASSCPYLYTWNGERFEFVTDFLGGGEMGNWKEHGAYHFPDSDEFVRIPSDKLKAKDGKYEIRVTNELEEVLFLDHLKLVAIEHDENTDVYPNEGLGIPTGGKQIIYTTRSEHAPHSAVDSNGENVLPKVKEVDRAFYDSFEPLNIRGYAKPHSLTLNLDDKKGYEGRTLLLLTGWTDYAFSSDNVAASQSGKSLSFPKLQVRNKLGRWQTVIDSIGISVGRPQTVVVDLTGKFLSSSREVRIVTNVKTYWDRIAVDTSYQQELAKTERQPVSASLRERGFSDERRFEGMIVPRYERVLNDGRWKYFSGRFTRTGEVKRLLNEIDDIFVISKTGDELALAFEALPEPSHGRKYTFLLYADGYSKEMDINSGSPDAVLPLPFKGMSKYPYGSDERFPMTEEKRRVYDQYTTRMVRTPLPRIETAFMK